ncbi:hypothetical protein MJO29_001717 [Puccinia striiformis f. sp. tritici]|nr:hypothetical protein MJO29_001717 [Puccinia striiformis f. sp. tritici]
MLPTECLVFTDESKVCLEAIQRTQGWAVVGEQTPRVPPARSSHQFNIIPAISTSGLVAHMVQQENVERFDFEYFLENILARAGQVGSRKRYCVTTTTTTTTTTDHQPRPPPPPATTNNNITQPDPVPLTHSNMVYRKYETSFKYMVVKAALQGRSLDEINTMHGALVSLDSLNRWCDLYERTRSVVCNPATYLTRGRALLLNDEERSYIIDLVKNDPTIYIAEIQNSLAQNLNIHISLATIWTELHHQLHLSLKKVRKVNPRQDPDQRAAYMGLLAHYDPHMLVFTDESGVCLDGIVRTQGWAPVGERTPRVVRERATHKFNIIPAVALSGLVAMMVQEENVYRFDLEYFLEYILLPSMNPFPGRNSVLIMDNASWHHGGRIEELIEDKGCRLIYLPAYSPDYNPIEKGFAVLKNSMRNCAEMDGGPDDGEVIEAFVSFTFTSQLMHGLFRGSGYIE